MMSHSAMVLCLLFITVSSNLAIAIKKEKRPPQTLSRGWGDDITWVQTYEEGLFHSQKSNKPLMVIHHLEDCQYCQALKKVFAQNKEIQEMAQNNFIMLNLMHETTDKNLSPDGQYVPRIMFVGIGEGNGNPLQCSCLENPRNGGAWWAAVYGVAQSQTRLKRLSSSNSISNPVNNSSYPSLTVRADITGRYSNRLYTYEPQDLPLLIENMKKALKLIQSEL